jgi:hypothetical protein
MIRSALAWALLFATACGDKGNGEDDWRERSARQEERDRARERERDRGEPGRVEADGRPTAPAREGSGSLERHEAEALRALLERLADENVELNRKLERALLDAERSTTVEDRDAAKARLARLKIERAELELQLAAVRAQAARIQRSNAFPAACLDNPLAKGCM